MPSFDEKALRDAVATLPVKQRAAFAASVAERLLPAYSMYAKASGRGDPAKLRDLLNRLWEDLDGRTMSAAELTAAIGTCMALVPPEDEGPWVPEQAYGEDAAAALAYALRCRESGDPQEAAWAARRAYEALDHYVIRTEGVDTNAPGAEARVLANPLIQTELHRQERVLKDLVHASPSAIRRDAERDAVGFFGVSR